MDMPELKDDLAALRIDREPEPARSRTWIKWVAVLLVLASGGVGGWRYLTRERPVAVEVATVTERAAGTQAVALSASGYVTARRRATVSSKITGKVTEVNVEEGMTVHEGQVLARLDDASARAALALAEAQADATRRAVRENEVRLDEAKVTYRRLSELLKEGIVTQAEVDGAKANVDSIAARISALAEQVKVGERQVELERTNVDNTIIRAPFTGVAISKDAQPGEMVSPVSAGGGFTRTGICTIVDMRSLEIEVDVNESYLNRVRPGQEVMATLDAYPDWQIPAHVITIVPTADRQKATVLVRLGFTSLDPRILPDMGIKVGFLRQGDEAPAAAARPTTLVPKVTIATEGEASVVFVVQGDLVSKRAVKVGGADNDRVEVFGDLRAGDRVVLSPPPGLKDGARVSVK